MVFQKLSVLRLEYNQRFKHALPERPFAKVKMLNSILIALKKAVQDRSIATMPSTLVFTNTQTCNLTCPFCFTHGNDSANKEHNDKNKNITHDLIHKFAKEALPFADEVWLSLIGEGLHMPISELKLYVDYFQEYGNKLIINTNATLLDNRRIQLLVPVAKQFRFSLDGASKLVFESIRKGAKFLETMRAVKILTRTVEFLPEAIRPTFEIKFTICGSNIRELPRIIELSHLLGINSVYSNFLIVDPSGDIHNEAVEKHKLIYNRNISDAIERAQKLSIKFVHPAKFELCEIPESTNGIGDMIINNMSIDYYETLPLLRDELDLYDLDEIAAINAIAILDTVLSRAETASIDSSCLNYMQKLEAVLIESENTNMLKHAKHLDYLRNNPHEARKYCRSVDSYMDVRYDGDSRLCCNGSHIRALIHNYPDSVGTIQHCSNVITDGISDVFNGAIYSLLAKSIIDGKPIDTACTGCEEYRDFTNKELIDEILFSEHRYLASSQIA